MLLLRNSFRRIKKEEWLTEVLDLFHRLIPVLEWVDKHSSYHDEMIEDIIGILEECKDIPTLGMIPYGEEIKHPAEKKRSKLEELKELLDTIRGVSPWRNK